MKVWRKAPYLKAPGLQQMLLDNWLLDRLIAEHSQNSSQNLSQPILRFYSWSPPAISLGYHQHKIPEHWADLAKAEGLDLVRRPSGGRAVLHKGDLTYAVILKADQGARRATYTHICEFLIQGLASLGIELSYGRAGRGYIHHPSCFSTATNADLVIADGRKMIGSAQVYRSGFVLQHGAIALQPDYVLLRQVFGEDVPVVGLSELLPNSNESLVDRLIGSLTRSAADHFDAEFVEMSFDMINATFADRDTTLPTLREEFPNNNQ
ncbi:biotin/lipoate A/B protein ligase family protein [Tumidithrix helvetica PCC 7403]|uniref:lipoate--protein ligase family protein n=1 Tax=Tumidithrix helvetica TaxID=3457545 RepID=UPI003CB5A8BF